jgi:hypothetical protein
LFHSFHVLNRFFLDEVWREEIRRYIAKAIKRASEEGPSAEVSVQSFYNRY